MKISKLKNILLLITTPIMLFFGYSIYEKPDNIINSEVYYNLRPILDQYQVIHSSKFYGTNYSILLKFNNITEDKYVKELEFRLSNFGGPVHFEIEKVIIDEDKNFVFYLNKSLFNSEKKPIIYKCSEKEYKIVANDEKDNHIKIKKFFSNEYFDEKSAFDKKEFAPEYCCGRRCKFNYTN